MRRDYAAELKQLEAEHAELMKEYEKLLVNLSDEDCSPDEAQRNPGLPRIPPRFIRAT